MYTQQIKQPTFSKISKSLKLIVENFSLLAEANLSTVKKVNSNNSQLDTLLGCILDSDVVNNNLILQSCTIAHRQIQSFSIQRIRDLLRKALASLEHGQSKFPRVLSQIVPIAKVAWLPAQAEQRYTLVLDLDETLVHYIGNGQIKIRPYCSELLDVARRFYEVVIFTAADQTYADWALNAIGADDIRLRLYRQHLTNHAHVLVKDLSKLGRSVKTTLIVDDLPDNFSKQPKNGWRISSWIGSITDTSLKSLSTWLIGLANEYPNDVRQFSKQVF